MNLRPKDLGCLAIGLFVWGGVMLGIVLRDRSETRTVPIAIAAILLLLMGAGLLLWRRRMMKPRAPVAPFSLVVIAGRNVDEQLVRRIAAAPRYPLTSEATIATLPGAEVDGGTRAALEGFVWGLQARYGRRGGRWEADVFDAFVVVYLE